MDTYKTEQRVMLIHVYVQIEVPSSWFQSKFNQKIDTYKLKKSVVLIHMYVCTGDASATKIDSFSQSKIQ